MSMYNMVFGFNGHAHIALGALGLCTEDCGRFRDAFIAAGEIAIYTRNGGGNREAQAAVFEALQQHPQYLRDADDSFDNTYATIFFSYPPPFADALRAIEAPEPFDPDARWQATLTKLKG